MFIHWHSIMTSDSARRVNTFWNSVMPIVSLEVPTALLLAAILVAPAASWADDEPSDTPEHVVGKQPYPFDTADPREKEKPPLELPETVAPKLELLTPEEIEFLKSGDARPFTGSAEDTVEALEERTPEQVKAWVGAMQQVVDYSRYQEGRDAPNIPFNTDSPSFNAWRLQRPRSMDPKREAGPVPLGRYGGYGGPPTFGGFPLALYKEDLVDGEVDVAILGAPLNMGSGWRDSGEKATVDLRLLGWPMGSDDQYVQVNASKVLNIADYGDVAVDNTSTERSMRHVRDIVREIAAAGAIPMIIGGDHSLEYPNVAALADVHGKEGISVIHFDAHYDAWWGDSHLISHGYPVYRLINEGHVRAADYIQVGLRSSSGGAGTPCSTVSLQRPVKRAASFTSRSILMCSIPHSRLQPALRSPAESRCGKRFPSCVACAPSRMWLASTWSNFIRHLIQPIRPLSTAPTSSRRV
jgi:agmatinase